MKTKNQLTEKSGLLTSINGNAPAKVTCSQSTVSVLKKIHRAVNAPIHRIEPQLTAINEALRYIDPLVYTTMGLGVYDMILNNAAGWPNDYRKIADIADMAVLPYLLLTFGVTAAFFNRNIDKRSLRNTSIAMVFFALNNFHNAVSAASFTEDTLFSFSLDNTDPNGSTPSDSNNYILYNILAVSAAVGIILGIMCFGEDFVNEYERGGKTFAGKFRDQFSESIKTIAKLGYKATRTLIFGSQFTGGTINQAAIDIKYYWLNQTLIDIPATERTALFVGGHGAGLALEVLLLAVESEAVKEFSDRIFFILAAGFFMEEYFSDLAISLEEAGSNETTLGLKITATIAAWLTILLGTAVLGIYNHRKKAANSELKANVIGDAEQPSDARRHEKLSTSDSSDSLPVDAKDAPRLADSADKDVRGSSNAPSSPREQFSLYSSAARSEKRQKSEPINDRETTEIVADKKVGNLTY